MRVAICVPSRIRECVGSVAGSGGCRGGCRCSWNVLRCACHGWLLACLLEGQMRESKDAEMNVDSSSTPLVVTRCCSSHDRLNSSMYWQE